MYIHSPDSQIMSHINGYKMMYHGVETIRKRPRGCYCKRFGCVIKEYEDEDDVKWKWKS